MALEELVDDQHPLAPAAAQDCTITVGSVLSLTGPAGRFGQAAAKSVELNLVLMTLNLLPVPPLDGGRILVGLLPENLGAMLERVERFGLLIVLLLIGSDAWGYVMRPILKLFLRFFLD